MKSVSWEEGVIGKCERFFFRRFPIGKMWARAMPTSLVSTALHNVTLEDDWGTVRPNVWFLYIAKSGLGYKTPTLTYVRQIAYRWARNSLP